MANKGSWLSAGAYLSVNDYLVSDNGFFFAIMQNDGNFVLYHGSGPSSQGSPYWASNTVLKGAAPGQVLADFATMQSDGNFVLYQGSDPAHQGPAYWATNTDGQGQGFAIMQNDGNFVLYHGSGPSSQGSPYWATNTVFDMTLVSIKVYNNGAYVARCTIEYDLFGQHQSQSSGDLDDLQSYEVDILRVAINVHVTCEDYTGLVWAEWKTILDKSYATAPFEGKLFTLTGTTLNPSFTETSYMNPQLQGWERL